MPSDDPGAHMLLSVVARVERPSVLGKASPHKASGRAAESRIGTSPEDLPLAMPYPTGILRGTIATAETFFPFN